MKGSYRQMNLTTTAINTKEELALKSAFASLTMMKNKFMNRDTQGRYARKSKFKTFLFALVVVAGMVVVMNVSNTSTYTRPTETATSTPEVATSTNPLDEIKAREMFQKRVENQAKQVYLSEQIADRKAQIAALEAEIAGLTTDLEETRVEELNFQ